MDTQGDLSPTAVNARLATRRFGRDYEWLVTCGSTNDEVAARGQGGAAEGLVVAADAQTGGRGRRGRTWHSPAGENLYCSLLLRPALPAPNLPPLTLLAGAALAQALIGLGFEPRLKWPNDVLLNTANGPRKVAGILTEMASASGRVSQVTLGLGVNANGRAFPDELAGLATSLLLLGGKTIDRGALLADFLAAFEPIYDGFLAAGPTAGLRAWREHAMLGQACWVARGDHRVEGEAVAADHTGALVLRTASGEEVAVHAGEVNWL
jgi:BirA family biotin operon repressor/biotin-[acetyl-CoA-carboxylase] ligase